MVQLIRFKVTMISNNPVTLQDSIQEGSINAVNREQAEEIATVLGTEMFGMNFEVYFQDDQVHEVI